jgi:hypothetical protein
VTLGGIDASSGQAVVGVQSSGQTVLVDDFELTLE